MDMNNPNENLETIVELINQYREQSSQLSAQINMVNASLAEHMVARETIKNYESLEPGSESLIPIGGNVYVRTDVNENKNVIVGIGARCMVEKGIGDCITTLNERIGELQTGRDKIRNNLNILESRIRELTDRAESIAGTLDG